MREHKLEFRVGLLIVVAVGVLAALVFVLGNFSLRSGYTLYVDYDFSGNIQPGAPVKVSGIKVGKVKEVEFKGGAIDEATGRRVQVRLHVWVEDRVKDTIRQNAEFFVNTSGVLGEQYLEIVPGNPELPRLEPGSIVVGVDPPRTDLIVARLYEVLDSISELLREDKDLIRNLLADSASAVKELNLLLVENREALGKLIVAAEGLATEATGMMQDVRKGLGDPRIIGKTVRDADGLLVSARGSIDALTPKAGTFLDDATRVTGIVTEERVERTLKVADGAVALTGKATKLVDSANGIVEDMRKGKGSVGAFLVREEVYADVREMIRDLKRNPWKFFWKE
jgi:phospholipid/cholesterol/gamma-HCH transport system substrate-binding protein